MSKRVLLDTNILIAFYNQGQFAERLLELNRQARLCVSAVSMNEFVRGAHDPVSRSIASDFVKLMEGLVVTPTESHWMECGEVSEGLLKKKKRTRQDILLLQNDILIALGARDSGSVLVTADKSDFQLLGSFIRFQADYWSLRT